MKAGAAYLKEIKKILEKGQRQWKRGVGDETLDALRGRIISAVGNASR